MTDNHQAHHSHRRRQRAALALAASGIVTAGALALAAPSEASSGTVTEHFFSKGVVDGFYTANGTAITNSNAAPAVGDYIVSSDLDYVGNHKRHAKSWTATDHLVCTFVTASTAVCDGEIAMGNSMLVADHISENFASNSPTMVFQITGGTGALAGAHGTVTSTSIGNTNNSDFTVTYST